MIAYQTKIYLTGTLRRLQRREGVVGLLSGDGSSMTVYCTRLEISSTCPDSYTVKKKRLHQRKEKKKAFPYLKGRFWQSIFQG
jgi:hypothetical protein